MFEFENDRSGQSSSRAAIGPDRFYVLMLVGDAWGLGITDPIVALPDSQIQMTALIIDEGGGGGMVVTSDDPSSLTESYVSLGFKLRMFTTLRRRAGENPHHVAMDLRRNGEYERLKQEWLLSLDL